LIVYYYGSSDLRPWKAALTDDEFRDLVGVDQDQEVETFTEEQSTRFINSTKDTNAEAVPIEISAKLMMVLIDGRASFEALLQDVATNGSSFVAFVRVYRSSEFSSVNALRGSR